MFGSTSGDARSLNAKSRPLQCRASDQLLSVVWRLGLTAHRRSWLPRQARQYRRSGRPHHFSHEHRQERQDPFGYFARDIGPLPGEDSGGKCDRLPQPPGQGRVAAFRRKEAAGARNTGGQRPDGVDQWRGADVGRFNVIGPTSARRMRATR